MSRQAICAVLLTLVFSGPVWLWFELQPGQKWRDSVPPEILVAVDSRDKKLLGRVMAKNLWDERRGKVVIEEQGVSHAAVESIGCELIGIAHAQLIAPLAIFSCSGQEVDSWKEHDTLPDNSMLAEIHADHVVIEQGEERFNVYLFGKE